MKNNVLKWLWQIQGKKKGLIAALTAVQAVLGGYGVLFALLLRNVVNSAVAHDNTAFWHYVMLILLLVAGQIALHTVIRWLNELSKSTFENSFKQRLTETILRKDYASICATHTGEWMNRLTNDTVIVANGCVDILPGLAEMIVKLVSALIMLIVLDSRFALILLPGGAALMALSYAFRKVLKRLHKNMQEKDGKLRVFLQERISSLMVVKSFSEENHTLAETADKLNDHKAARMKRNHFSNFCNTGFGVAMNGMYLFGIIYCAYGILTSSVSYGTLTAVMQLIGQIQAPFANISGYLPRWYAMIASAERLMEAEQLSDDLSEPAKSKEEINQYYHDKLQSFGFRNASFSYAGESMPSVLENLSLDIRKGEAIAFTGPSGCGKSTILKLLMNLYSLDSGEAYVDDQALTASWRKLFAYVPQESVLMSGTIREVISFADPNAAEDNDKLQYSLSIACASEFVSELENKLDTLLGERGAGLSEGQIQRLAIARAIFADAPILLLDEATSALDMDTERRLLQNLKKMTDKTVIIVTHRPAALSVCDRVYHFAEGKVTEA